MSTAKRLHYDYDDYLATLAMSDVKLEFCDGVIYAMAGGTPTHAELAASMIHGLKTVLPGCSVYTSDLKVRVESSDLSTFPDASVVCGPREFASVDRNALANPTLLVEVTSRSTEDYDRGDKLSHYKQIPSLRAVLFVSHRERRVTVVARTESGWSERDARAGESLVLEAPAFTLAVDDVYAGVALEGG